MLKLIIYVVWKNIVVLEFLKFCDSGGGVKYIMIY